MSEWQLIETAPVSSADDPEVVMLWVADGGGLPAKGCCAFGRCYRLDDDSPVRALAIGFYGNWNITHWQPLPEPPTA